MFVKDCVFLKLHEILLFFPTAPKWIKMFVLDEADEMLSRGFKDQIYEIFQKLSTNIQVKRFYMVKVMDADLITVWLITELYK